MKAVSIIIAAAIIATTPPALAMSDLEYYVADHNQYCYLTSAKEITGTPEVDVSEQDTHYTYEVTKCIRCIYTVEGESVTNYLCVCLSDSEIDEFLAQCVTGCYSFCGIDNGINCYDPILYRFLLARGGHESEADFSLPGVAFSLSKASFGYYFILSKAS